MKRVAKITRGMGVVSNSLSMIGPVKLHGTLLVLWFDVNLGTFPEPGKTSGTRYDE